MAVHLSRPRVLELLLLELKGFGTANLVSQVLVCLSSEKLFAQTSLLLCFVWSLHAKFVFN